MKRILLTSALLLCAALAFAQKGNIGFIYPAGGQRGTSFTVTVGGQGLAKAQDILFSGDGISATMIPVEKKAAKKKKKKDIGEEDNLQLADVVKFNITIADDAKLGMRDVRLVMPSGVTNRLYFEVGQLPDVLENPKEALSASSSTLPVTFNGQVTRSDVDRFRFEARKGQKLVLETKARVFVPYMADAVPGWFQPVIRLYGPSGKEVAYNDDYTFHVDPVIFFEVHETGSYEVEINDALYRGREDFVYRISVGELPFITSIDPIGGKVGKKTKVTLRGWNLPTKKITLTPRKEGKMPVFVESKGGLRSNSVLFSADRMTPVATAGKKHNTSLLDAWDINQGEICDNTISEPLQQHWYRFDVEKKTNLTIEILSRRLGTPADLRLTVYDSAMKPLKDVDDVEDPEDYMATHFADPVLTRQFSPGHYFVRVIEAQGKGGEEYSYRLSLDKTSPDFMLNIEPSSFNVPEGGTGYFNVVATRKYKFAGEIDIDVSGLPAGYKVSGGHIQKGANKTFVTITAPMGAAHKTINPVVKGSAVKNGETITRNAIPAEEMMQAFYYKHMMPIEDFRMVTGDPLPISLKVTKVDFPRTIKVHLDRRGDFSGPVTVMLKSTVNAVKGESVVIPAGETEATLNIVLKNSKQKKDKISTLVVYGVVKGTSKKIAGKGRGAYTAAATAYAPAFDVTVPKGQ